MNPKPLKLYYAAGPGDVAGTFRHWLKKEDDPGQFALTYSSQFFDVALATRAEALAVSTCERAATESAKGITVVNRPLSNRGRQGRKGYLLAQLEAAWNLWRDLLRFRPHAVVIAEGTTWWTLIAPLRILGIRLIPSIHCVLWPPEAPRSWKRRMFDRLERFALRAVSGACLSASEAIDRQLPAGQKPLRFLPTYRRDRIAAIPPADSSAKTFRLLYAGRIVDEKGVFDLLEAFQIAQLCLKRPLHLDFCGTGPAFQKLAQRVRELNLGKYVSLKGHCSFEAFQRHLGNCHAVVVPTTSRFVEGFNQVIVEGFLSGRKVIATSVCPSAHDLAHSVVVVRPDSPKALAEAIEKLAEAPATQASPSESVERERESFFDDAHSWRTQLWRVLDQSLPGRGAPASPAQSLTYA